VTAVRFAPSPLGRLDLDNARTAIINWLFARKTDGRFLLRLDDTSGERSREDFVRAFAEDLAWLGLGWDHFARQSERLALYAGAAEKLKAVGRLYPCFESDAELEHGRAAAGGKSWIYDRAALAMSPDEMRRRLGAGEAPHWRFKLTQESVAWEDLIRGRIAYDGTALNDPIAITADGTPCSVFATVVDDVELDISHVIRGDDHVDDTAAQIEMFAALGRAPPNFAHIPLAAKAPGQRLDSVSLAELRDAGFEPMAVNSLLAKLGTADPIVPRLRLEEFVVEFDLSRYDLPPQAFDRAGLEALNAGLLRGMPFGTVSHRLPKGAGAGFWEAVRPLLRRFGDVETWWRLCQGPVTPLCAPEDAAFLARAAELLPAEPFDGGSWDKWLDRLKALTGRKDEALLLPLRRALTGLDDGPELRGLLPTIGRARAHARLIGKIA
jgi:glutamyl-tRNA synthetase